MSQNLKVRVFARTRSMKIPTVVDDTNTKVDLPQLNGDRLAKSSCQLVSAPVGIEPNLFYTFRNL